MSKPSSKKQRPVKPIHPKVEPKPKGPAAYVLPAEMRDQIVTAIRNSHAVTIGTAMSIVAALSQLQPLSAGDPADG